jgi:hypothetical protein
MLQTPRTSPWGRYGYVGIRQIEHKNSSFTKVMERFTANRIRALIDHEIPQ